MPPSSNAGTRVVSAVVKPPMPRTCSVLATRSGEKSPRSANAVSNTVRLAPVSSTTRPFAVPARTATTGVLSSSATPTVLVSDGA